MNRRNFFRSIAAGLATLALSTKLAQAVVPLVEDEPETQLSDDSVWIKMERRGNEVRNFYSYDNKNWAQIGEATRWPYAGAVHFDLSFVPDQIEASKLFFNAPAGDFAASARWLNP